MINRFRPTNTFHSSGVFCTSVFNPQIQYMIGPPLVILVPSFFFVSPKKPVEEIPPQEWKNTTTLAIPTIPVPPPIKLSLEKFLPFTSFATADDYVMTESDYQAMNTSISAAEFVLE